MSTKPFVPMTIPPDLTPQGFYVGTSGYYYDDWIGIFNPRPLSRSKAAMYSDEEKKEQDRLFFYQKYFPFVEINSTFYAEPSPAHFLDIAARSKPAMNYSVKVHKDISHTKTWDVATGCDSMKRHIEAVSPLIETGMFYSFLIQLEDHLYRNQKTLDYLLAVATTAISSNADVHIELRHISWHDVNVLTSLKNAGVGICNTEIPAVKHRFPLKAYATSDKGYIRYSGRNLATWYPKSQPHSAREKVATRNARYDYLYSDEELKERMKGQLALSRKASKVAVAYNNHYEAKAIRNAMTNLQMLLEHYCGARNEGDS